MDNLTHEQRIDQALADLAKQLTPNYARTAKKHQVNRTTLRRRFEGTQFSRRIANSECHQCLTIAQEQVLIGFINKLTERSLPPTSQIIKNVAEEICGVQVGKNWVGQFANRYKDVLH